MEGTCPRPPLPKGRDHVRDLTKAWHGLRGAAARRLKLQRPVAILYNLNGQEKPGQTVISFLPLFIT